MVLQVSVGVILLLSITINVNEKEQRKKVYDYANYITIGIFLSLIHI